MRIREAAMLALLCGGAIATPSLAHHGDAGYDTSKLVTVKGTVTDYRFANPHIEIFLDVKKDDGSVEKWTGEMNSPNIVARISGWNGKTFKPGDELVLEGNRAKNGLTVLRVDKVSRPDGTELYPKGSGITRF
jgi:hypothetical protein